MNPIQLQILEVLFNVDTLNIAILISVQNRNWHFLLMTPKIGQKIVLAKLFSIFI